MPITHDLFAGTADWLDLLASAPDGVVIGVVGRADRIDEAL